MHGSQLVLAWALVSFGVVAMSVGVVTLTHREPAVPWLRGFVRLRHWGWTQVAIGAFCLLVSVPLLAQVSADVVFVLRCLGLIIFVLGRVLDRTVDLARVPSNS